MALSSSIPASSGRASGPSALGSPILSLPQTAIETRLVDFEKIIRNHIYHPAFGGSFSLKKVMPALFTDISYDGLAVRDGSAAIAQMARGKVEDVDEARRNLLAYCKTDTLVMVRLHEIMARMATASGA